MCGFNFVYYKVNEECDENRIKVNTLAIESMSHRGPDFYAVTSVMDDSCYLSHARLSIIDVSATANQPMESACGRFYILFNGEIYNFKKIKHELSTKFPSITWLSNNSDTEVLLNSLIFLGFEKTLKSIEGMFAFVLLDKKEEKIVYARDCFGEKPLYKYESDTQLVLSSDISSLKIICGKDVQFTVRQESVAEYLKFGSVIAPNTIYENIEKVPAATYSTYLLKERVYSNINSSFWDMLEDNYEHTSPELKDIWDEIDVKTISDVGFSFYLSGGIDSSLIATRLSSYPNKDKIKAHSIGFEFEGGGEVASAADYCNDLSIKLHSKILDDSYVYKYLELFLSSIQEPNADPTVVPGLALAEQSARFDKVVLTGEGADELFWGYPHWNKYILIDRVYGCLPSFISGLLAKTACIFIPKSNYLYELLQRKLSGTSCFYGGCEIYSSNGVARLIGQNINSTDKIKSHWADYASKQQDILNWYAYIETKHRLPELICPRVDYVTMAFSQEARSPFLSKKLFEKSKNIDFSDKFDRKINKPFMRDLVSKVLPYKVLNRKKKGFSTPFEYVFMGSKRHQYIEEVKEAGPLLKFSSTEIDKLIVNRSFYKLWSILVLVRWYKNTI